MRGLQFLGCTQYSWNKKYVFRMPGDRLQTHCTNNCANCKQVRGPRKHEAS